MSTQIFQIQSTLILTLMVFGIIRHKRRHLHWKIMTTTMVWDVILILQIELNRQAIFKASKALTNPMLLNIHVSLALMTVVGYIFAAITGPKVLKNVPGMRRKHKIVGWTILCLRILTFLTSFVAVVEK